MRTPLQRVQRRPKSVCLAVLTADGVSQARDAVVLPPTLKNSVVVLDAPNPEAPGGVTKVYLLGMSHVSKVSVNQVKELVRAVKPDVVGVELCRDRLGLLVDSEADTVSDLLWHCRKVEIDGLPAAPEWPKWEALAPMLRCRMGRPVTQQDIEADVITLLSTGLFRKVFPQCQNAGYDDAPAFLVNPAGGSASSSSSSDHQVAGAAAAAGAQSAATVRTVPPLGCIRFSVQERVLPPITEMTVRLDSSLKSSAVSPEQLQQVCADTMALNNPTRKEGQVPALACLLKAKLSFAALFSVPVTVAYTGVETGRVEATVRASRPQDTEMFVSGFESSAVGGDGWGIETFKPKKNLYKISNKLYVPMDVVDSLRAQARGLLPRTSGEADDGSSEGSAARPALPPPSSQFREWSREEIQAFKRPSYPEDTVADSLGLLLTGMYAKHQSQAARKVGVTPGSAWQAALAAASEVGSQQVVLIDRPTIITERKLADALLANCGARLGIAAGLIVSSLVAAIATDVLPATTELAGFAGVLAAAVGLCWPLWRPINQVSKLAEMTPEQIEDAVAIKEPIASGDLSQPLKLFGEDALLEWPGAMEPIIKDRDTYMAKALAAAATGQALFSPTYVRDEQAGQMVWRYMSAEGAPQDASPAGLGDGACKPLRGAKTVVGIVGSAHVRGMVREWDACCEDPASVEKLLKVDATASS